MTPEERELMLKIAQTVDEHGKDISVLKEKNTPVASIPKDNSGKPLDPRVFGSLAAFGINRFTITFFEDRPFSQVEKDSRFNGFLSDFLLLLQNYRVRNIVIVGLEQSPASSPVLS